MCACSQFLNFHISFCYLLSLFYLYLNFRFPAGGIVVTLGWVVDELMDGVITILIDNVGN